MTIIQIEPLESGQHPIQSQSGRSSCWEEGWIKVPSNLESEVWDSLGWCDLKIEGGELTGVTATEKPELASESFDKSPTQEERILALESAMLSMMGVTTDV